MQSIVLREIDNNTLMFEIFCPSSVRDAEMRVEYFKIHCFLEERRLKNYTVKVFFPNFLARQTFSG